MQTLLVALIVLACSAYAAWTLIPAAWRRPLAVALLRLPLPAAAAARLTRHATAASGCGCDGCDRGTAAKPPAPAVQQPLVFHPRLRK